MRRAVSILEYRRLRRMGLSHHEAFTTSRFFLKRPSGNSEIFVPNPTGPPRRFILSGSADHRSVARQVLYGSAYVPPDRWIPQALEAEYKRILDTGARPLIVDLGAHIGTSAVRFELDYPGSQIVALEPDADNVVLLRRNLSSNRHAVIVHGAIAAPGVAAVQISGTGQSVRTNDVQVKTATSVDVYPLSTLRDLVTERTAPLILKADIEGAESQLFTDPECYDFPFILFEPHDRLMPGGGMLHPFFAAHVDRNRTLGVLGDLLWSVDSRLARKPA